MQKKEKNMNTQYAVLHTEKGSISSGGIGNHIDRKKGAEHTYKHADPNKRHLNIIVSLYKNRHELSLSSAIKERIKEGYNSRNKKGELKEIRKDAVKYCTHILSGSHELMKSIAEHKDERMLKAWIIENFEFMKEEFGKENIVRFVLHMDEKTPHIHCITVPLTKDGRLSAKEIIGNRQKMQERQDRYAEKMKPFGFERGIKNTGIKHEDAKEYYQRINETSKISHNLDDYSKNYLGVKVIQEEKINNVLKTLKIVLKENEEKNKLIDELKKINSNRFLNHKTNQNLRADLELKNNQIQKLQNEKILSFEEGQKSLLENEKLYRKLKKEQYEEKMKRIFSSDNEEKIQNQKQEFEQEKNRGLRRK